MHCRKSDNGAVARNLRFGFIAFFVGSVLVYGGSPVDIGIDTNDHNAIIGDGLTSGAVTSFEPLSSTPPIAPSGLASTAQTTSSISWSWQDNSSDETGFVGHDQNSIQRWSTGADVTSFTEMGLRTNTRYTRHVHAFNGAGDSTSSNTVSVYTAIETAWGVSFGEITTTSIQAKSVITPSNLTAGSSGLIVRNRAIGTNSGWKQNNDLWTSDSLTPNKSYSFTVQSRNGDGVETPESLSTVIWTLPKAPSVSSSYSGATCPVGPTLVTFTNLVGFGTGSLSHYHYAWNRNPTYTFLGSEPTWSSGTLQQTANAKGAWYLHLVSHNGENVSGGTADVLVQVFGECALGDYDENGHVDQADMDQFWACVSGPEIPLAPTCAGIDLDDDSDLDQDDYAILQRCFTGALPANLKCK